MSAVSTCPAEAEVVAFVDGSLPESDAGALTRHLAGCPTCRDRAVEYRALGGAVSALDPADAVRWQVFESRFGPTFLAGTDRGLARVSWTHDHDRESFRRELEDRFPDRPVIRDSGALEEARAELEEYFAGERSSFDLPVDLRVMSDFERRVLATVREVPFGEVIPYGELARRIGRPRAARAVGNALGKNPVAIVVPCHRVIRGDGSLGGYMGGVEFKRHLLAIEGREDLLRAG